jgi:parvulin-like peptidyl-prolyl isomerase
MNRFAVLTLLAAASACATTSPRDLALAKVNDETVTGEDLRQEFGRSHRSMEKILGQEDEVRRFLTKLVDRRLFVQEGYRMGIHETPEVREGVAKFRTQRMLEAFFQEEVDDPSKGSDDEVFAAYASLSDLVEARQAVFRTKPEAEAALAEIATGADFEKLARERSIAPSALRGGMIAVRWGGDEVREKVVLGMKEGELAPVFETSAGWEVVRVEKRRQVQRPPFDKVVTSIRGTIERRKKNAREKEVLAALWAKYDARVLDCAPTFEALEAASKTKDATPCASWRGGTLTTQDLLGQVKLAQLAKMKDEYATVRPQLLEDLLSRKVAALEAEERGYGNRPALVAKVHEHEEALVESRLYSGWVIKDVTASDEDGKAFHAAHPERFVQDAQYELAQIVVDTPEQLAEVEEKIRTGQPFEELAKAYTKDKEGVKNGGYVGWLPKRALQGPFAPVAALGEGQVSGSIKAEDVLRVVKVLRVNPEQPRPYEEVKDQAKALALQEKQKAEQARWVEKLRAAATVKVNDRAIRSYEKERAAWLKREQEQDAAKKAAETAQAEALAARAKALPGPPPATPPAGAPGAPAPDAPATAPAAAAAADGAGKPEAAPAATDAPSAAPAQPAPAPAAPAPAAPAPAAPAASQGRP